MTQYTPQERRKWTKQKKVRSEMSIHGSRKHLFIPCQPPKQIFSSKLHSRFTNLFYIIKHHVLPLFFTNVSQNLVSILIHVRSNGETT